MIKLNPDHNKNCIGIDEDVFVLEKEMSCRVREETELCNYDGSNPHQAKVYRNHYIAIYKSVNMGNYIIYKFDYLNEPVDLEFSRIVKIIKELEEYLIESHFLFEPSSTLFINEAEDVGEYWFGIACEKTPEINSIEEFVEEIEIESGYSL